MSDTPEYGWLIEVNNSELSLPVYFAGLTRSDRPNGETLDFSWSFNHIEAVRFCRRQDAEKVVGNYGHRIVEHVWDDGCLRRSLGLKEKENT